MAQVITEGPVYRTTETTGVVNAPVRSYSRYGGRSSVLLFVVLLLLLTWMYATRGFNTLGWGVNREPASISYPTATATPFLEPGIGVTTESAPVPLPATPLPATTGPVDVRISEQAAPVQLPGTGAVPATGARVLNNDFIGVARILGDNVNMRIGPNESYRTAVVLPRDWDVYIMRQSHTDNSGRVWIEVSVNTQQGVQKGWINQRYLSVVR